MKYRVSSIASFVSAAFAVCTLGLWLATFSVSPWHHYVLLTRRFHVSVWSGFSGDTLGRLVIFNNADYGPYRGSIIGIMDEKGEVYPRLDHSVEFGDSFGVYYRYFRWPGGGTLWTLMLSLWYPLVLFSILPVFWVFWRLRLRHIRHVV